MKIKIKALSEEMISDGFKLNELHDVLKVEISGDTSAYDIFYMVKSKAGHITWMQDITIEEIEIDKKYSKFQKTVDKFINEEYKLYNIRFKFKFELEL